MKISRLHLCLLLSCFVLTNCTSHGSSNDSTEPVATNQADTNKTDYITPDKEKALASQEAIQQALWEQYDSIKLIRSAIPDSIANCKSRQERYYYNVSDGKLDHIQSDIRNLSDSILLAQLKVHVADLSDVISANATSLNRLDKFTSVLKKLTFGISKTIGMATILLTNGLVHPKISLPAQN